MMFPFGNPNVSIEVKKYQASKERNEMKLLSVNVSLPRAGVPGVFGEKLIEWKSCFIHKGGK